MLRALMPIAICAAIAGGCYAEDVGYTYGYASPTLSYVAPGVQVVTDYDYPVFFADGFYWRWYGGTWYSSPYWNRGWVLNTNVPFAVRGIQRPWAYAHFRPGRPGIAYRSGVYGPAYRGPAYRGAPAYRAPVYRGAPRGTVARPAPHPAERR